MLFLSWRDSANPAAGGAETFTEEIGKRLVMRGNKVTIFASRFMGCEPETSRSGITTLREGGKYTVYARARNFVRHNLSSFDVIIDEINTIPFQIHKVARTKPTVALIHQLAKEIWFYETHFPLNLLGYFALEPLWLRGYRRVPTITVSNSTRNDLLQLGFRNVSVVNNGIGTTPLKEVSEKESNPTLIFVGRLVKSKQPHHAITAFKRVRASLPNAELWILGDGYLKSKLQRNSFEGIRFFGRVSEKEKFDLLRRAHVLLAPSVREGWGISVLEANAMGTPAVGYDVSGLRDSIINGKTGFLVQSRPTHLAGAAIFILSNSTFAATLCQNSLEWSRRFSWDESATLFHNFLMRLVDHQPDMSVPSRHT